jgi:hypothetical protein
MGWVDAGVVPAQVVEQETLRDGTPVHLIVIAMGRHFPPVPPLERVPLRPEVPLPDPTTRVRVDPVVDRRESWDQPSGVGFTTSGRETSAPLPLRLPYRLALALPARTSIAPPDGIGFVERMTSDTMSLRPTTSGDRVPPEHILSRSNRLEVRGVHAGGIPAQVVQMQARRDWAAVALVVHSVRGTHMLAVTHLAVATTGKTTLPDPASRYVVDDVVNRRESGGPLVVAIDVADWSTLDVSIFRCGLLGKRSRQAAATVAQALIGVAIRITAHGTPGVEEPHFNPRPMGNV